MGKIEAGNNKFLKALNQARILDLIRTKQGISRAELSEITGLTPTAIGVIITKLLKDGYIIEEGIGESTGGRRPILLKIKPNFLYSIGVDIDVNCLRIVLIDITGNVCFDRHIENYFTKMFEKTMKTISDNIDEIIKSQKIERSKILGIGISIPGMIEEENRNLILAPNLKWEEKDIGSALKESLQVPVYIENEAMASAIGEHWFGSCQGINHFVCINAKSGIGSGIFINGKPYRGIGGCAGEIGHIVVDEDGPQCGCGNYGCLEAMVSTGKLVERAKKLLKQGAISELSKISSIEEINFDCIIEAARNGDEISRNIFNDAARYIGIAISSIVNILNPESIVLGKELVKYSDLMMSYIEETVKRKALRHHTENIKIIRSSLGENSSVFGAAVIPVKIFFNK